MKKITNPILSRHNCISIIMGLKSSDFAVSFSSTHHTRIIKSGWSLMLELQQDIFMEVKFFSLLFQPEPALMKTVDRSMKELQQDNIFYRKSCIVHSDKENWSQLRMTWEIRQSQRRLALQEAVRILWYWKQIKSK